jgi:hypothetical protein
MWGCGPWGPDGMGCPAERPLSGDACTLPNQYCTYGGYCGVEVGPDMLCQNGYWRQAGQNGSCTIRQCGSAGAMACGGPTGATCGPSEWCSFPDGSCGAGNEQGQCRLFVSIDNPQCGTSPVCGCDGRAYCAAWAAHLGGTDTSNSQSCIGDGGNAATCLTDADCQTGLKCCASSGHPQTPMICKPVATGGGCPLVP